MTTNDPVNKFLDLEQRTTAFLEELERLREETRHYSKAADGLDTALNQISTVSERLGELSVGLREVVETLKNIGTPELLKSSQVIQEEVKHLREEVQNFRDESTTQLNKISDYEQRGFFAKLFGSKQKPDRSK